MPKKTTKRAKKLPNVAKSINSGASDFLTTVRSIGASNAPTMNEKQFRSFNKTDAVPEQKMMAYLAAPCSTGYNTDQCNMGKVQASNAADYASAVGGKKKATKRKNPRKEN